MAKKNFRAQCCSFSHELRQRQLVRGLGLCAIATLLITAHFQQTGRLHTNITTNPVVVQATSALTPSIISSYQPQTIAAVSQAPILRQHTQVSTKRFPAWSIETITAHGSFTNAAHQAGLTNAEITGLKQILSDKIDFKRLHKGDQFRIITERVPSTSTHSKATDHIIAAQFISLHNRYTAIRHTNPKTQEVSYYQPNGSGLSASFLRYPTHYTRIGSGFSQDRLDPVTGKYHSHPAIDFDAPMGTPIVATADGKISFIANERGYGNLIKITHPGEITTIYAHMQNFASGLHMGSAVKKGQAIGYVGMSGYATGPHVHYEVHFGTRPMNPLTTKLPSTKMLANDQKTRFAEEVKQVDGYFRAYA